MTDTITLPRSVVEQALEALWTSATPKAEDAIRALRAALDQPQPLPSPIWRLVPTTMTNAMAQADQELRHAVPWIRWEAILAAAPQPPVVEQPQVEQERERFAALVAAAEREACAKVCTEIMDDFWIGDDRWEVGCHCAESIRARGQQ